MTQSPPELPRRRRHDTLAEVVAREEATARRRALEEILALHIRAFGLPIPEREYSFHPERKWRLDFAWPAFKIAAEVEGLTHHGGRHQRIAGYQADLDKYNAAAALGWTVLRFSGSHVRTATAIHRIEEALEKAKDRVQEGPR